MILLTGGTGFAGRHLVTQFVAEGRRVRVLSRTPGRVALPDSVAWARGDLAEPDSLRAALRDVSIVVHAAALLPDARTPASRLEQVNAGGTEALARAAREAGVRRFVHIGSAGVYGDSSSSAPHRESSTPNPGTPYEQSKLSAELALASALDGSEVRWTILRPQGLYGPDRPATADLFRAVARRRFWLHGPARVIVHPTHVADLAAAVRLVMDHDSLRGEVINVGGARPLEFHELISLIGMRVGHTPRQVSAPIPAARLAALAARMWAVAGNPPALLTRLSRVLINRAVNIEKARNLLGFEPVALEWGLDRTAAALLRSGLL